MQTPKDLIFLIATKGRAGKAKLLTWLNDNRPAETTLFVEPHEIDSYRLHYPNLGIVQLLESDRGLAYARNAIYEFALHKEIKYFWMPDDDITGFFYRLDKKMIKKEDPWQNLQDLQRDFIDCKFFHAGLEYQQFAWAAGSKVFNLNSFCDAVVWFNMDLLKTILPEPPYREELKLKVDRDFCMQVIAKGGTTARSTTFALSMPKEGSNTGGLKEIAYDHKGLEESMVFKLQEIWGDHIVERIEKPDGRIDAKIHWNKIREPKPNNKPNTLYDGLF